MNAIMFRWQPARLRRSRNSIERIYRKLVADAKAKKANNDEVDDIRREELMQTDLIDDEIRRSVTHRLFNLADKYLPPKPELKPKVVPGNNRRSTRLVTC
jgi:hypothetical protein